MMHKLNGIAEKFADQVSSPRRMFLLALGNLALATVGVIASTLASRSAPDVGPDLASQPPPGSGACYYSANGVPTCQVMTQFQCGLITGSTYSAGSNCTQRPV
jgi:hypothetical protein